MTVDLGIYHKCIFYLKRFVGCNLRLCQKIDELKGGVNDKINFPRI